VTEVVELELSRLLKHADGDALKAYKAILKAHQQEAVQVQRTTVAQRKEQLSQALESYDLDRLLELQQVMTEFVDEITDPLKEIVLDEPRQLTKDEAQTLMKRWLSRRDIDELLDVVKDRIRAYVIMHVIETNVAKGVEDPEHANGRLEVPELGHAFCIEGNGQKDPALDEAKLQELLGDRWTEVCEVEYVPAQEAHEEYYFSPERYIAAAKKDPALLEVLKEALTVGGWKTPRLVVRPLSGK
jgi:hypothetical protein